MGRLDIYISNKGTSQEALDNSAPNGGASALSGAAKVQSKGIGSTILKSSITHTLISTGINSAKTTIQTQISLYGDTTGDYYKQSRLENTYNNVTQGVSTALGLGMSFAVNPVMGFVTLGVTAVGWGIQSWQQNRRETIEVNKANTIANFNSQRLGAKLVNGNR